MLAEHRLNRPTPSNGLILPHPARENRKKVQGRLIPEDNHPFLVPSHLGNPARSGPELWSGRGKGQEPRPSSSGIQLSDTARSLLFPGQRSLCTLQHFRSLPMHGHAWEEIPVSLNSHRTDPLTRIFANTFVPKAVMEFQALWVLQRSLPGVSDTSCVAHSSSHGTQWGNARSSP